MSAWVSPSKVTLGMTTTVPPRSRHPRQTQVGAPPTQVRPNSPSRLPRWSTMADADRTSYTYGDSALAGDRLALLASIFEPTTAAFLRAAAMPPDRWPATDPVTHRRLGPGPDVALDLGCGPGFTSRLIGEVVAPARVVGFDFSD